jgi:hypothetical protein
LYAYNASGTLIASAGTTMLMPRLAAGNYTVLVVPSLALA